MALRVISNSDISVSFSGIIWNSPLTRRVHGDVGYLLMGEVLIKITFSTGNV